MMLAKLTESKNLLGKTFTMLMASYYVYHVRYPKDHSSILQLFQDVLMRNTEKNARRHTRLRSYSAELLSQVDTN